MKAELPGWAQRLIDASRATGEDIGAALRLAEDYGKRLPLPGRGGTASRWAVLAAVSERNLTVARVLEAHSDALAILAESGAPVPDGTWGVFAAEAPQHRLEASDRGGVTVLTGVKPWCSLAGHLDAALVTAHAGESRQLFRVSLHDPSVGADPPDGWVARGLRTVTSVAVSFDATPAEPVGAPGWYLSRPGFAWGGMGVAACWHGGARGLQETLRRASAGRTGELPALHAGIVDAALFGSAAALGHAAELIDAGKAEGTAGDVLGLQARAVVADAVERTIRQAGHALGPAPLAFDEDYARRVADLELYVRQHHGERDLARLGAAIGVRTPECPLIRRIVVVVPAANEEQHIARCLSSIAAARSSLRAADPSVQVQITVVPDSCTDLTTQIARAHGVQVVPVWVANVGAARRAGARAALAGTHAGELWLASTDADSEVPTEWLTGMLAEARRGAHVVLGTVLPAPDLCPEIRAEWLSRHHLRDGHPHIHGANLGIRGDAYAAVGGWQPLATGEDVDLARRAAQNSHLKIARIASIPVVTSARWAGRAPRGFSSYLRALSAPAPSTGMPATQESLS